MAFSLIFHYYILFIIDQRKEKSQHFIFISDLLTHDLSAGNQLLTSSTNHLTPPPSPSSLLANPVDQHYPCHSCPAILPSSHLLRTHISNCHVDQMPFRCELCGRGYFSAQGLGHHKAKSHEGKTYACPICDVKKTQKHHLKDHMKRVHKIDVCTTCGLVVPLDEFDRHLKSHLG